MNNLENIRTIQVTLLFGILDLSHFMNIFRSSERVQDNNTVVLGPFSFGLHQIWVSFVSSIIVVPPNLLIDFLFRKSRYKPNKVHPLPCQRKGNSGFFACFKLHTWSGKGNQTKAARDENGYSDQGVDFDSSNNKHIDNHGDKPRWSIATWASGSSSSEMKRPATEAPFCDDGSFGSEVSVFFMNLFADVYMLIVLAVSLYFTLSSTSR